MDHKPSRQLPSPSAAMMTWEPHVNKCSRCNREREDNGRLCLKCRETKRTQQAQARKSRSPGLCYRCGARDSLPQTRHCARCMSYLRERTLPHLEHDLEAHALLMTLSCDPQARCQVTGRSLLALRKVGQRLSVDRQDSTRGYVDGNMQLMALDLNSAKGAGQSVPQRAVHLLLTKLAQVKDDRLSLVPGATHQD